MGFQPKRWLLGAHVWDRDSLEAGAGTVWVMGIGFCPLGCAWSDLAWIFSFSLSPPTPPVFLDFFSFLIILVSFPSIPFFPGFSIFLCPMIYVCVDSIFIFFFFLLCFSFFALFLSLQ